MPFFSLNFNRLTRRKKINNDLSIKESKINDSDMEDSSEIQDEGSPVERTPESEEKDSKDSAIETDVER